MPPVSSSADSSAGTASSELASPATEESQQQSVAGQNPTLKRTPVEAYQENGDRAEDNTTPPASDAQAAEARKQNLNQSFANYAAQDEPEPSAASKPRSPAITKNSQDVVSPGTPSGQDSRTQAALTTQPTRTRVKPVASEPISFWQVPQALRDGLPEIRITVLVYAEATEDRFVLINGQRLVEKEELAPGVVLDEIRRDGAVFSYRKYRFLVKG